VVTRSKWVACKEAIFRRLFSPAYAARMAAPRIVTLASSRHRDKAGKMPALRLQAARMAAVRRHIGKSRRFDGNNT